MEPWSYDSVEKGFAHSNDPVFPSDSFDTRTKNVFTGWGFKEDSSSNTRADAAAFFVNQHHHSPFQNHQRVFEMGEFPFPPMMRKQQSSHDSIRNGLSSNGSGGGDVINAKANTITSNANSGDDESSSKLSISAVESTSRESSLIDLKLGRFGAGDCFKYHATAGRATVLVSAESSTPAKRMRASGFSSQPAFCQVYGCNKDLSQSKDYHKRHKVCEVHSKSPTVVVNGIEQRFCQQCSRFHLLGEFDEVKRSCRKRLAGHNERRRKPQLGLHSSRAARFLHSYTGSVGSKSDEITNSFICQDILPSTAARSDKVQLFDCYRHIKLENEPNFTSKLPNGCFDWNLQQRPSISLYGSGKQQYPLSSISENINQYPSQENVSHSIFQAPSLGSEDLTLFDTASTIQGLQGISEPGCALSLLSSQPQNSSSPHASGMPTSVIQPMFMPESGSQYSGSEVSQNLYGFSSMGLSSGSSDKYSPAACRVGSDQRTTTLPLGSNGDATAVSDFRGGTLHGSDMGSQFSSYGDGPTIDLLQLSTQLERVENQRQAAVPMKQENDSFCCFLIPETSKASITGQDGKE